MKQSEKATKSALAGVLFASKNTVLFTTQSTPKALHNANAA